MATLLRDCDIAFGEEGLREVWGACRVGCGRGRYRGNYGARMHHAPFYFYFSNMCEYALGLGRGALRRAAKELTRSRDLPHLALRRTAGLCAEAGSFH